MQHKIKLFGLLASISLLAIIFLYWYGNKTQKTESDTIQPTPILTPLHLENTIPQTGEQEMAFPNSAITFVFNQKIKPLSYTADIDPKVGFEIEIDVQNPQVLYLKPKQNWQFRQKYNITLTAQPSQGLSLEKPVKYSFTPIPPTRGQEVD